MTELDPLVCCTDPDRFERTAIIGTPGGHHLRGLWRTDPAQLVQFPVPQWSSLLAEVTFGCFDCVQDRFGVVTVMPLTAAQIVTDALSGTILPVADPLLARRSVRAGLLSESDFWDDGIDAHDRIVHLLRSIRARDDVDDLGTVTDLVFSMLDPGWSIGMGDRWEDHGPAPAVDDVIDTAVAACT